MLAVVTGAAFAYHTLRVVAETDGESALAAIAEARPDIADVLCCSPRTVDHHRANIATKLDLHGNHALTRFAVAHQSEIPDP